MISQINIENDPFWSQLSEGDRINLSLVSTSMRDYMKKMDIFENFIDFTNAENMKKCLPEHHWTSDILKSAKQILARIYESSVRPLKSCYGAAFPADAEVLAYAMKNAANKNILEIAGASGETSIMMAFAGAKQVYYNDITESEIATFKNLSRSLPPQISKKLQCLEGNCFDITSKCPEISKNIDLVICRNLIHFFNKSETDNFFSLLKNVLSAGGRAIITTNAKYAILNQFDRFHEDTPSDMCFTTTQCFVYNYGTNAPPTPLYGSAEASDWENNSTNFKAIYLYQRNEKTNNKWKAFPTESGRADFEKISSVTRKGIIEAYNNMKHEIAQIKAGSVRIVISSFCAYNKTALRKLFKEQGFDVEATFLSNNKGHLSEDTSAAQLAGIMVKLDQ